MNKEDFLDASDKFGGCLIILIIIAAIIALINFIFTNGKVILMIIIILFWMWCLFSIGVFIVNTIKGKE